MYETKGKGRIFKACVEAWGPYKLNVSQYRAYLAVPILKYMHQHEVPIEIPCSMNRDEVQKAMTYGAHASAVKYNNFLRRELEEKIRAGHVAIFILTDMQQLLVLCLTPISETYQTGRNPILL